MSRLSLFGIEFDDLTLPEALARVDAFVASGRPHRHVAVNVDTVVLADRDPSFRAVVNAADLVLCDGMPLLHASRLLRRPLRARVAGVDLFQSLLGRAGERGWRPYLLGARPDVVAEVARRAQSLHPGLALAGIQHGYFPDQEEGAVVRAIRASGADLLFVALPSPRKQRFLQARLPELGVPFAMGVGGSFDVYAGRIPRAPLWVQRAGMEWFHRFLQEPRKLFGRYFVRDARFLRILARELLRRP